MNQRERIIRLWFDMWLQQKDLGIDDIFTEDVIYIESWSPQYENRITVKHWFEEWNTRGKVLAWTIKQFFHKNNQTICEWYFKNRPCVNIFFMSGSLITLVAKINSVPHRVFTPFLKYALSSCVISTFPAAISSLPLNLYQFPRFKVA